MPQEATNPRVPLHTGTAFVLIGVAEESEWVVRLYFLNTDNGRIYVTQLLYNFEPYPSRRKKLPKRPTG